MNAFDLPRLPGILRTRWRWPLGMAAGLVGLVVLGYLLMAPVYRATAAVALDTRGVERLLDTQRDANPPAASMVSTDMDVIRSEAVLRGTLDRTILGDTRTTDAALPSPVRAALEAWRLERQASWQKDTEGRQPYDVWLLRWLAKPLTVQRAAADSGVVSIQLDHPSPEVAQALCNAVAQAYLAVALDLSLAPTRQAAGFFESQVRQSRQALAQAQALRNDFQREHGLVSVSEASDIEAALMSGMVGSTAQASARGAEAAARGQWAMQRPEASTDVLHSDSVQKLDLEMARLRAELAELRSRLGDQHPQLLARRQQLEALQTQRQAEALRQAEAVQQASRVAQGSELAQQGLVARQRDRVLGQKSLREQLAVLQQDVDAANHRYQVALERHAQAVARNESALSTARLLAAATLPLTPTRPPLLLAAIAAGLAGVLLGCGAAVLAEQRRPRLRTGEDLAEGLGLPLLASVPALPALAAPRRWWPPQGRWRQPMVEPQA